MRERIRIWTENVETFVLEVITEQRRDRKAAVVRFCLFVLSKVFAVAVKVRRFLYNMRILRDSTLGVQVIAIGNLTVGGTGKTPVVEKFARELQGDRRVDDFIGATVLDEKRYVDFVRPTRWRATDHRPSRIRLEVRPLGLGYLSQPGIVSERRLPVGRKAIDHHTLRGKAHPYCLKRIHGAPGGSH